jgi:pimeloyl-ACP methyl ester carboxylesterase
MPPPVPPYGSADPGSDEQSSDVLPPFNAVVPLKARVAMRAGEAQTRSLQLRDGRQIQVLVAGPESGVPVVFHHGTPFAAVAPRVVIDVTARRGVPMVLASRPGYAGSTALPGRTVADAAADTIEILDQLGHSRFYAVGWSGGGPHALACAALVPDRCLAAATIAGVAPYEAAGLDWLAGMGPENVEEFSYALEGGAPFDEFLTQSASAARDVTGSQIADELGGLLSAADRNALSEEMAEFLAAAMRAALSSGIEGWREDDLAFVRGWGFDVEAPGAPVAIWQGDQDNMVPAAHGAWLAGHVPGARRWLLSGEGHLTLMAGFERVLSDLFDLAHQN